MMEHCKDVIVEKDELEELPGLTEETPDDGGGEERIRVHPVSSPPKSDAPLPEPKPLDGAPQWGQLTLEDLAEINKHTRRELLPDEVYVFDVVLCDNEIDRDLECFDSAALPQLAKMFVGKTGIYDHDHSAKNQLARIFSAQCVADTTRKTSYGADYCTVQAKAYIPRTAGNVNLIAEIEGGIKKEVSVGCAMGFVVCSVCGQELRSGRCEHKRGRSYRGKMCYALLKEPRDAYEWSFVAVPAQPLAGVRKQDTGMRYVVNKRLGAYYEPESEQTKSHGEQEDDYTTPELARKHSVLEEEAREIMKDLRRETAEILCALMPHVGADTAQAITKKLSYKQCRELSHALREKQSLKPPCVPQLFSPTGKNAGEHSVYRI
ncbi:MAG: hypothetical protein FWG82_01530 [Oscillospiraceae bacterium]|nr:hypothetical protein [Oscillospiraceae bacterium]